MDYCGRPRKEQHSPSPGNQPNIGDILAEVQARLVVASRENPPLALGSPCNHQPSLGLQGTRHHGEALLSSLVQYLRIKIMDTPLSCMGEIRGNDSGAIRGQPCPVLVVAGTRSCSIARGECHYPSINDSGRADLRLEMPA